jgi:hypothetical protein
MMTAITPAAASSLQQHRVPEYATDYLNIINVSFFIRICVAVVAAND